MADSTETSPEVMLQFYRMLYPFKSIFTWLNQEHTPKDLFTNREFAFTLQGDVYLRYNCFSNADELKKQVCALNPTRFEIGPMYSSRPSERKLARSVKSGKLFTPLKRELVFDIDMTDYDDVRTCCTSAGICKRCWAFIANAVRVLDSALRTQFGYHQLLWVYSGRRGIHLWVSDDEAMGLTDELRRAVVGALTVIEGGKEMAKKVNVRGISTKSRPGELPPSLWHARDQGKEMWYPLLDDQECFLSEDGWRTLLKLVPDKKIVETLEKRWETQPGIKSSKKWDELKAEVKDTGARNLAALEDIILQYTYPRLDAEVSKHRNHLLKAPFCVHPKTGRVCVPVDPNRVDHFDPNAVPTVMQLLQELDKAGEGANWEHTSLKQYVDMLDGHVARILDDVRRRERAKAVLQHDLNW
ncbi:prim-pol domain-containing protein [Suillus clintonianus]|uniref:prim-pol domain-containing protein n=1 Tax=Suillus clintonianus TaxID=1904413 RepID=UPI001B85DA9A|nr:prim-pol domain-containing protein [Suillus clintonianus]KAG2136691.1 prim-pol domain-containing protein [Suillus clintonianus]